MNDILKVTGTLNITLINEYGDIKESIDVPNMIVSSGKNYIVNRMKAGSPTAMGYMALGINDTPSAASMTTLVSESIRVSSTSTVSDNSITYSSTFPSGSPSSTVILKEAGIFNSASTGTMLARTTFGAIQKLSTDTVIVNWTITIN